MSSYFPFRLCSCAGRCPCVSQERRRSQEGDSPCLVWNPFFLRDPRRRRNFDCVVERLLERVEEDRLQVELEEEVAFLSRVFFVEPRKTQRDMMHPCGSCSELRR